jgi:PAS domain S-box-containing protein
MEQFPIGKRYPYFIAGILVFLGLYLTSLYNYLLFHSLAEIFSIVVACGIFMVAWNSRRFLDNNYLLLLGIGYLFVGGLDLIHTLTYKGMGIFQGYGTNLATQLWIAARYTESLSLLIAPLFIRRKLKINLLFSSYLLALLLLLISIFYWNIFPLCFVEGVGLTPFKKISEYIISVILLASIALLLKNRTEFDRDVFKWVVWSILLTIASELAFTFYMDAYGFSNLLGHFLKIVSFYLIYKALIGMGLTRPYDLLFRHLKQSEMMVREDKNKIQNYLDIAGAILVVIDANQTVSLINKKGCQILGYEEKEIIGKNWFDTFIPEGIREEFRMTFKSFMKGETNPVDYFENPVLTKTGEERMIAWHNAVLRDEKGNGVNTLSSGEDITDRIKMEKALIRLASFPELNPNPVVEVDLAGEFSYLNPAAKRLFPDLQMTGLQHPWLVGLESLAEMFEHQKKSSHLRELRIGDAWYQQTIHYVPEGKRLRIYSLDITDRKQAEEAVKASEKRAHDQAARLQAVLDTAPAIIWIAGDRECREITGNRASHVFLRVPEGTDMSKSGRAPERLAHYRVFKDGVELTAQEMPIQRVAASGQGLSDYAMELVFNDGAVRSVLGNISPVLDPEGHPNGAIAAFIDITERKRTQEALRTSLERYRSYIEVTGELGWTTNADGEVVEDIPSFRKFTGQTDEEVKGWGWSKALHPDDLEHTTQIWREAVKSKSNYEVEYRLRRHDGIYRYFLARGTPVFKENGSIREWVGTCIDITKRKGTEEELRKSRDELELRVRERTAELANAYKELKEQSRILESFFKYTVTPLVFLDRDFNFIRVNEAYAKACRRDILQFPGHNHFEFYPSDAKAKFEQVVQTKEPYAAIARPFTFPDHPEWGTTYWDWTLTPILDDAGEVESLVLSLEDVTKRKRAEEAVKAERQRFNDVLEMLPAYLVLLTPDYHVPFANRFFRERFGESHGKRCFEYLFGRSEPCETCETYTALKTMAPHEWEWTGPDGRFYDVSDFPFTDTDGSTLILEMGIDITERKRAEEQLKAAHQYNRILIEASLDPFVTINTEGKITDANTATELITGVPREQLIGSDFSDYFTDPQKAKEGYKKVFSKGTIRDYPLAIRHTSGMITDVLYNATVYRNEAGEIQGIFAAARDITDRKRAEEALRESENRLRVLSSQLLTAQESERKRIALELHDGIGQMLTAIKFKVESILQEEGKGKAKAKEKSFEAIIPMVRESVDEVRRMQMDLRPSTLDDLGVLATLGWFCREYQKIYSHIHIEKEIGLQENEVSTPRKVVIYRLTQEAMNNIAKHSQADLIHLSLRRMENEIELVIKDNGMGFDLEEILSPERSKRGLGLSSMRERTELSGGAFTIETTPGKGTTIRASWPL